MPTYQIIAKGPRAVIEKTGNALADMDPTPAAAVDMKEDGRSGWRLDVYANSLEEAFGCAGIMELVAPELNARVEELEEQDWVTMSLEGLPPVRAGRFIVAGSHALTVASPGKTSVLIEAGPAFGTGHHGTTLGCLLAFQRVLRKRRPGRVLDLGTGSGVLAIAALKVGANFAVGTDIDKDSVGVARENALKNSVASKFRALHASGARHPTVRRRGPYDTVFANILARPLVRLAPDIEALTAPGGVIILSGLLAHQEPQVRGAFTGRGLTLTDRVRRDGWSTLVFRKPKVVDLNAYRAARRAQRASRRASMRGRGVASALKRVA
ncbi:MAG: 50S ribosomal protein L11 methyltransferase [Pseudomonadota bacterium]